MVSGRLRFISKPAWLRYGLALFFVLVALALTQLLWLFVDRPISAPLFLVAIVLSSWLCGFRAGIFATTLSGFLLDFFFIPPIFEFSGNRDEIIRFIVFFSEGAIISWVLDLQREATDELRSSREHLQALTNHLHTVRESEQKRIALEIHDELGQALTGVKMGVHWLSRQISESNGNLKSAEISSKLDEMLNTIDSTVSSVRRIATELRPSVLDDFGLIAAIEWQIQEFERIAGIPCKFRPEVNDLDIDPEISTAVFRIFQEALTNITRHANASTVEIIFRIRNASLFLSVTDDGIGIKLEDLRHKRSLGILGMKERAKLVGGSVEISPIKSGGTEVELIVPLSLKNEGAKAAA